MPRNKERQPTSSAEAINHDVMYERGDVHARTVGWVALGIIATGFLIHATVKLSYGYFAHAEFRYIQPVTLVTAQPRPPRVPALQVDPQADFEKFKKTEEQVLSSYSWVDQQQGIVRIPIDEAMKQVVANGLPRAESSPMQSKK